MHYSRNCPCLSVLYVWNISSKNLMWAKHDVKTTPKWSLAHRPRVFHQVLISSYISGLVQDCSISSALALEILQPCMKPMIDGWVSARTIHGLAQYCGNSIANALELPQSWAKPSNYITNVWILELYLFFTDSHIPSSTNSKDQKNQKIFIYHKKIKY